MQIDKEDYIYDYNNIFSLTDSGLNKIKELNDGNHKIQFKYINKKILDVDFIYRNININNPETSNNNLIYIYSLFISIIGLLIIIIYKRKVISYE